ncbi:hypothetical protein BSLG_005661 [Batrachochytrium salamandrivorans]|nr:hypothetical protein BSLG_005661 [Batrachochytrium salamandrivorans]
MLSRAKSSGTEESSFLTQLTTKLLDNLQLSISNIHIRYEDSSVSTKVFSITVFVMINRVIINQKSNPNRFRLAWIYLSELSAVSTDADWKEGSITVDHPCIYKIARDSQVAASQQFILNPVSGEGKVLQFKLYNPNTPKTDLQLIFDEFAFNLDEEQYSTFIELFGSFSRYMKSYPYRMFLVPQIHHTKNGSACLASVCCQVYYNMIFTKKASLELGFRERRDLRLEYISHYMQLKSGTLDYEGSTGGAFSAADVRQLYEAIEFDPNSVSRICATMFTGNYDQAHYTSTRSQKPKQLIFLVQLLKEWQNLTSPFFSIKFEHKPLDGSVDDALTVKMLPLEIVLNPYALRTLAVAQDAIQEVTTQTRTNLEFAIEGHRSLNLKIEVDAPIFLIPTNFIDEKAPILVIDAGHLSVKSIPISMATKELLQNEGSSKLHDLEKFLYDQYLVDFTSVQVLVVAGIDEYHLVMDGELWIKSVLWKKSMYRYPVFKSIFSTYYSTVPALNPPSKSKSEEWYRALTSTSAPLIPTDSDDEFHDAQETISSPVQANSNLYFKSTWCRFCLTVIKFQLQFEQCQIPARHQTNGFGNAFYERISNICYFKGSFDMQAKCSLKSISIENLMLPESSPFRCLVGSSICDDSIDSSTIDSSHLVKIEFDSIQPASPDYADIHADFVNFNSTRFVISREWIQRMYVFSTDILRRPESLNSAQVVSDLPSDSSEIPSDSNEFDNVSWKLKGQGLLLVFNLNVKSVETIVLENDHRIASGKFESLVIQAKLCGDFLIVEEDQTAEFFFEILDATESRRAVALDDEHRIEVESMRIVSVFSENADHPLPMVDKVDLDLVASIFHDSLPGVPKKQIIITFSPVIFNLTDDQYQLTVDIWRAFNAVSEAPATQSPSNLEIHFAISFHDLGMYFCTMDARDKTQLRFIENFDATLSLDSHKLHQIIFTNATVYLSRLVFWVSYHDMVLLSELSNRILGLLQVDRSQRVESPQTTAVESSPVESNDIRRERAI